LYTKEHGVENIAYYRLTRKGWPHSEIQMYYGCPCTMIPVYTLLAARKKLL